MGSSSSTSRVRSRDALPEDQIARLGGEDPPGSDGEDSQQSEDDIEINRDADDNVNQGVRRNPPRAASRVMRRDNPRAERAIEPTMDAGSVMEILNDISTISSECHHIHHALNQRQTTCTFSSNYLKVKFWDFITD